MKDTASKRWRDKNFSSMTDDEWFRCFFSPIPNYKNKVSEAERLKKQLEEERKKHEEEVLLAVAVTILATL